MRPPSCHSNSYSPIHFTRELQRIYFDGGSYLADVPIVPPDVKKVCPVRVDNLAFNYHRGKWEAWKDARKMTPTNDEVHLDKGRSVFWLFKNGVDCPAITTSYYEKVVNGETIRKYYISGLTAGGETFHFIRRNGTREEDMGRLVNYDEGLNNSTHVLFIEPECHRLMLAQNVRLDPRDGVVVDNADVQWFRPVIHHSETANFLETNPRVNTEVRPYQIPSASHDGWPFDVQPYGVDFAQSHEVLVGQTVPNSRVDWRYNPRWISTWHGDLQGEPSYDLQEDPYRHHPILGTIPQNGANEELWEVWNYDPQTGAQTTANPEPKKNGGIGMTESCALIEFACGLSPYSPGDRVGGKVPLADMKYYMSENGAYHYEDPNGNRGVTGEWDEWDAWDSEDDLIMLYGMKSTKVYRKVTKDITEEEEDENGQVSQTVRHIPVWVYDHTEWKAIYWEPIGAGTPVSPAMPWGAQMMKKLRGREDSYSRTEEMIENGWKCSILHEMEHMADLIGGEKAFDLRLYCIRYNWKVKPIVPDKKYNEQTHQWENQYEKYKKYHENGEPVLDANGEQVYDLRLKVKVSDDPSETKRGFFNTLCRADVRRIVKAKPVGAQS